MMRCSVGVKSRPSTRVVEAAVAAEQVVDDRNTSVGSKMNSAVPRSGFTVHEVEVGRHDEVAR